MDSACAAGAVIDPEALYGPLAFIPCTTGEANCEEPKFEARASWDPTGSGDMLLYTVTPALDDQGRVTKLFFVHQYPETDLTDGTPYEAVAFEVEAGRPVAAWLNDDSLAPTNADITNGTLFFSDCTIDVGVTATHFAVLAKPGDAERVLFGAGPLEPWSSEVTLQEIDADESVTHLPWFLSLQTAAFEQGDGKLFRADLNTTEVVSAYAPEQRLSLVGVAGNDVITATIVEPLTYSLFARDASFAPLSVDATYVLGDGQRLVWLAPSAIGSDVWVATRGQGPIDTASGTVVAGMPPATGISGVVMGDGHLAVLTGPKSTLPLISGATDEVVYLLNLTDGTVRLVAVPSSLSQPNAPRLLAVTATHVWLGVGLSSITLTPQFERVVRLAVTGS